MNWPIAIAAVLLLAPYGSQGLRSAELEQLSRTRQAWTAAKLDAYEYRVRFRLIERALAKKPFRVAIDYDPKLGYTLRVFSDPSSATDDETVFVVEGFRSQ